MAPNDHIYSHVLNSNIMLVMLYSCSTSASIYNPVVIPFYILFPVNCKSVIAYDIGKYIYVKPYPFPVQELNNIWQFSNSRLSRSNNSSSELVKIGSSSTIRVI